MKRALVVGGVTKYYVEIFDNVVMAVTMLTTQSPEAYARDGRVRIGWSIEDTVVLDVGEAPRSAAITQVEPVSRRCRPSTKRYTIHSRQ